VIGPGGHASEHLTPHRGPMLLKTDKKGDAAGGDDRASLDIERF